MRVKYSCVVDRNQLYQKQGWLWLNSLIILGKINPADIWIHCVRGVDASYIDKCVRTGANVTVTEPFGDKKYCNKIAQMFNEELKDSDAVILMDTDMIMLENFEEMLNYDCINAKIVDMPNPPTSIIGEIFALAKLRKTLPAISVDCADDMTYDANFNGGLYVIPQRYYDIIQSGWAKWANWLISHGKPLYESKRESNIDQLSFCMTVHESNIPINHLSRLYNYPLPYQLGDSERIPYVLHYHTQTDENHLLLPDYEPVGKIKEAVETANKFISQYNFGF